jgi:hypothetical protein
LKHPHPGGKKVAAATAARVGHSLMVGMWRSLAVDVGEILAGFGVFDDGDDGDIEEIGPLGGSVVEKGGIVGFVEGESAAAIGLVPAAKERNARIGCGLAGKKFLSSFADSSGEQGVAGHEFHGRSPVWIVRKSKGIAARRL